jgi:urate oxidase
VEAGPTVERATIRLVAHPWARLGEHEHAFQRGAGGERVAVVSGDGHSFRVEAGVEGLEVLRTTGSGWSGFVRDDLTTLPETDDRILATAVSARWIYAEGGIDYTAAWHAARDAILDAFGDHYSPSVQFTLRRMGRAVLKAVDAIDRVHLSLPNRHHLLYDLSRFGVENPNEIFHATTEPYGLIEGTVAREQ